MPAPRRDRIIWTVRGSVLPLACAALLGLGLGLGSGMAHAQGTAGPASASASAGTEAAATEAPAPSTGPLRDAATGLGVVPPAGYTAQAVRAVGSNTAQFALQMAADKNTACQVAFAPETEKTTITQPEINALADSQKKQDAIKAALGAVYLVSYVTPFVQNGVEGLEAVGDFKQRRGMPPQAQKIRSYLVFLDTPKGRTSIVCVTDRENFEKRRADFNAVAHSVTAP